MKLITILTLLVCLGFNAFAQHDPDKMFYLQKAEKYRRMKNTGAVLTVTGAVLAVVGIATLSNTTTTVSGSGQTTTTGNVGEGVAAYLIGSCALGAGVPLWIVGAHAQKKYEIKLQNLSSQSGFIDRGARISLTYRF